MKQTNKLTLDSVFGSQGRNKNITTSLIFLLFAIGLFVFSANTALAQTKQMPQNRSSNNTNKKSHKVLKPLRRLSKASATCVSCHKAKTPAIYQQWGHSRHFNANVGCYECHKTKTSDVAAIRHKDFVISTIVTPTRCATCHMNEVEQFTQSHHAEAGQIIGSLDNVLAEVVEGALVFNSRSPVEVAGCWQCHGSSVKVLPNGDLDPTTWPNTGIGRINPDGSKGACTACHQRHKFSIAQARRPETCGKCHLGPDHPQKEIYDESKHGINFYANVPDMNLTSSKWIVGEDYDAAPTCATCHMSATRDLGVTHDVGDRISWTLRPPISEKVDAKAISQGKKVKSWIDRRKDMKNVCSACHGMKMVDNFYEQFDQLVNLYNNKFAIPGTRLMKSLADNNILTKTPFDTKIKWSWFRTWHHAGRRARHGAAMMAPDYVQWLGMFETGENFYTGVIPEAKELIDQAEKKGNRKGAQKARAVLNEILNSPEHSWFIGKAPPGVSKLRQKQMENFKKRYLQKGK